MENHKSHHLIIHLTPSTPIYGTGFSNWFYLLFLIVSQDTESAEAKTDR